MKLLGFLRTDYEDTGLVPCPEKRPEDNFQKSEHRGSSFRIMVFSIGHDTHIIG